MSKPSELLRGAPTSTRTMQQNSVQVCTGVAQHVHIGQHWYSDETRRLRMDEFEVLLAIVGPAHKTPAHENAEIRAAAWRELPGALPAYKELARQIEMIITKWCVAESRVLPYLGMAARPAADMNARKLESSHNAC